MTAAVPPAAVIVPTAGRPAYLDVALRSIMPQATEAGADVLVVADGPSEAVHAVAARHGARHVAHDRPRGLNAARNTGARATDAPLLVYVDDDVAVRPGWLAALLAAAHEQGEDVGVLTGPVIARFEDHRFTTCGREGPPITHLELGPRDRDCERAWGANMAVRRSALERIGPFDEAGALFADPARRTDGDEEEWQARLIAAGGRLRYVAAAALDHRRAGDDARLRSLCRAAGRSGRAVRRYDAARGRAPSLALELRVLAGCLLHGPRRRCMNGPVMSAHSLGRVLEALAPASPSSVPGEDFLSGTSGTVGGRRGRLLRAHDALLDVTTWRRRRRARRHGTPRRRVLAVGVRRTDVPGLMPQAVAELRRARHDVVVDVATAGTSGKFENLNLLLARHDLDSFDWLLVLDDDVDLPHGFLDTLLACAEAGELRLAQPAHRRHSHAAWPVTRRVAGADWRETTFVEIGPVTAFHRDTFATLLPFPDLRMGWGLDAHWSAVAREHGWPIGVVDAAPVGHTLRPVADTYPRDVATAEARAFLADRPYVRRDDVRTLRVGRL